MKREYEDYLRDMLENAEKAISFVEDMDYDDFCKDDKAMYAVIRAFEIIGEAARQILMMFVKLIQKSKGVKLLPCEIS
jgi:uncharacterized protein with HEPN domain